MARMTLPAWLSAAAPIIAQMQQYRAEWIGRDITAGFAIAAVALPIGVAYPAIAGLPPVVGLYASILPLIAYAIFGSSRQLIVGPDAATLTILAAVLAQILGKQPDQQPAEVSAVLAVVVGIMCLLSAATRLGFIANFLSRPILTGYLCGISLTLLIGQIGRVTTVHLESKGVLRPLFELSGRLEAIHLPTLLLGAGVFAAMRLLKWRMPRSPGPLIAVVIR
jgi:sulfate permease, SulP family